MLRQHDRSLRTLLLVTDIVLCAVVFGAVLGFGAGGFDGVGPRTTLLWIGASLAFPLCLRAFSNERSIRLVGAGELARALLLGIGLSGIALAAGAYALRGPVPPEMLLTVVAAQLVAVGGLRIAVVQGLRALRRRGRNFRNVLVLGSGPRAAELTSTIENHPEWGLRIVGYVDEAGSPFHHTIRVDRVFKLADFHDLLRNEVIDEVITACPRGMLATLGPAVEACGAAGVPLTVMTDLFGDYLPPPRVRRFAAIEALTFAPVHHSQWKLAFKRGVDVVGAGIGLLVAAPPIALAALAIKLTSKGPVFFRQIRCGLYGRPFLMLKLRTMAVDADDRKEELMHMNEMDGPVFKIARDPRITPVGAFLRKFSIDELPQLWNVFVGDMSLVGPRPPVPSEVARYETAERRRLSMRPGLTCLWQVSGRNSIGFDEWVKLDLQYIDSWSLSNDFKLMMATIPTVLRGTGA